jgi:hypothetical protein
MVITIIVVSLCALVGGSAASGSANTIPVPEVPTTPEYRLPWTAGASVGVNQNWGFGCSFDPKTLSCSHDCAGPFSYNCYAYDFGLKAGADVLASADGTVEKASTGNAGGKCGGTLKQVSIRHADGSRTVYYHVNDAVVQEHAKVRQG